MRRGDVVIAAGAGYADKPRPCVVLQADEFAATDSLTVCLVTSQEADAPDLRIPITLTGADGAAIPSWVMVDKVMTLRRKNVRQVVGRLSDDELAQVARALIVFLSLA